MANILSLQVGDSIIERTPGGKKIYVPIKHIVFNACSKKGVHVNRNACYDNTAVVEAEYGSEAMHEEDELEEITDDNAERLGVVFGGGIVKSPEQLADEIVKV